MSGEPLELVCENVVDMESRVEDECVSVPGFKVLIVVGEGVGDVVVRGVLDIV